MQVCKKMSDAYVAEARDWSRKIVNAEMGRGAPTLDEAMQRASMRHGIDHGVFWGLRYRPPQDILTSIYFRLKAAYEAEVARQERLLRHEMEMAEAAGVAVNHPAMGAAKAALGNGKGKADPGDAAG